jgi:hypothetical protein
MARTRLIVLLALAASAPLFYVALRLQGGPLVELRRDLQLAVTDDVRQNLPPQLAFTQVALGSFRGLAVDVLWARANLLKQEGKFYELMQLSNWITMLQPRFAKVWEFQAWNMAFNLSEATHTPQERWMWIQAGIRLLRDQGIPLNPRAVSLYQQLAWICFQRVARFSSDMHWHYKHEHAREWHAVLGAPPGGAQEAIASFQSIAEAPAGEEELRARQPEAAARLARLDELDYRPDRRLLDKASELLALRAALAEAGGTDADRKLLASGAGLLAALDGPPGQALLAFVRARVLRDEYHMDPLFMLDLLKELGPLDWRHPAAHTVYWALLGARRGERQAGVDLFELVQADRMVLHGLQALAFGGKLHFDPRSDYFSYLPEPLLFDAFERASREAALRQRVPGATAYELEETHRGFLVWAVQAAWLYGSRRKAEEYYGKLREIYGVRQQYAGSYAKPLDEFVSDQIAAQGKTPESARQLVVSLAFLAFSQGVANSRAEVAQGFLRQARRVYDAYQEQKRRAVPNVERQPFELPPLGYLVADGFAQFILAPPGAVPLHIKKRTWDAVPKELKWLVWDSLKAPLHEEARRAGRDPAATFPEPPGMDEFRQRGRGPREGMKDEG